MDRGENSEILVTFARKKGDFLPVLSDYCYDTEPYIYP